jgi:spermidine/putrescine transport system permease protein
MKQKVLGMYAILVYLFLYLPIVILIVFSFNRERINAVWTGFTFDWYLKLFQDASILNAMLNSFIVASVSTMIATAIGTLAALGMSRYDFRGKRMFDAVLHLPIVIPDIMMAIALLSFFVLIKATLGLYSIILAHVTFNIAFVAVVVRARLADFDRNLEYAAMDLGATPVRTFRHVTLPLIMPGIIAGALMAFTLSWDDFMIAFFTAGVGSTTLPLKVYSMIKFGVSPEVNAISTLMLFFSMAVVLIAQRFQKDALLKRIDEE